MTEPSSIHDRTWGGSWAAVRPPDLALGADVLVALAVAGLLLAVLFVPREFGRNRS